MRKLYILLIVTTLFALQANGQSHFLRGKVIDDNNFGVPGATVVEVDENDRIINATITDMDGNYSLNLTDANTTVKFSFIGFKTVIEEVNGRAVIDVNMQSETQAIDAVVVTASKKSSSITAISDRDRSGSAVTLDMAEMKGASITSVSDALQGQVAGLDIMGGGTPGSGSNITIRGLGSLGGSSPLIVVDGIKQQVSTDNVDFGSADADDLSALLSIAPEDIKEVRVLKDAAETAVWGSQGANGVIEITTLSGKRGPTKFEVNYKRSYQIEAPTIPMLNGDEYVSLQQEMWHNAKGNVTLAPEISYDKDYADYYNYAQNTDWLDEISRMGSIHDVGFRFSGGGEKTSYFASVNYKDNIGTLKNTENKLLTGRLNVDYKISTKLRLNTQITYTNSYVDDNWKRNRKDKIRKKAIAKAPNMAIYVHDENGNKTDEFFNPIENYQGAGDVYYNPVAIVNLSDNDKAENKFQSNFNLNYRANNWIALRQTVSFQFSNTKQSLFLPYTAIGAKWLDSDNNSSLERNTSGVTFTTRTSAFLTAMDNSVHHLSGTLMWETTNSGNEYIQTATTKGASVDITDPSGDALMGSIKSEASQINDVGGLGQVLYKLYDRHIFQLNARVDASSRFGSTFRWGFFPSVSYAWRFSDVALIKDLGFFDDSKFRLSWGRTGNAGKIKAYERHGYFSSSSTYMGMSTLIPTQPELERLKWETSEQVNIGVDLTMFKGRFDFTVEWYQKDTEDILFEDYEIASASGYNVLNWYNSGGIQNKGWELNTRVTAIKRGDFRLSLNFNIYSNQNTFTEFPPNLSTELNTDLINNTFPVKAEIGTPVGSFFGLQYEGVYSTTADAVAHNADGSVKLDSYGNPIPMSFKGIYQFQGGDAKYKDMNNDGVIDINDVIYLGDSNPDFAGGFGINTKYKGLQLNANFLYRSGYQIVNEIAMETESMNSKSNQSTAVLHRWRVPGQDYEGMLPRAYMDNEANNLGSDRYVEDGDFLRLNSLSLYYNFGSKTCEKLNLDKLKVGFVGRKLYTFTKYSGQDPEVSNKVEDPFWFGTDDGSVPAPMVYAISLEIGF